MQEFLMKFLPFCFLEPSNTCFSLISLVYLTAMVSALKFLLHSFWLFHLPGQANSKSCLDYECILLDGISLHSNPADHVTTYYINPLVDWL